MKSNQIAQHFIILFVHDSLCVWSHWPFDYVFVLFIFSWLKFLSLSILSADNDTRKQRMICMIIAPIGDISFDRQENEKWNAFVQNDLKLVSTIVVFGFERSSHVFHFFFSAARLVLMINSLCPKSEKWIKYELIDSHVFNQRIIDEKCGFCQQKTQTNRFDHVTYLIEITTAYEYCILMWHSTASSLVKNVIINSFTFIIWINYQYNRIEMCRSELIFTSSFNFAPKKRKGKTKYMQKFIKQRRMRWEARENSSLLCIFSFDHLPQTYLRRKLSLFCKAIRKTCKISGNDDSCRHYSVSCKKTRSRNTQSQVDLAGAARAHDEQWR